MGFFRELRESWKEGLEEGRAEARAELATEAAAAQAKEDATEADRSDFLQRIPYDEQFGVALAAPFRVSAFNDWFTIFKDEELTEDEFPKHLYAISEPGLVGKRDLKDLKKLLARDFEITDGQTALWAIGQLFAAAAVPSGTEFPFIEGKEDTWATAAENVYNPSMLNEDGRKNALTLFVNMAAHACTACVDVGYLQAETALALLGDLRIFVKSLYGENGTWAEYGTRFLAANDIYELNDEKGMKILRGHVQHLLEKQGSPWVNVPFHVGEEEIVSFDELVTLPEILALYDEEGIETVEAHIENNFGKFDKVMHEIVSPDVHIDVAVIEPSETCEYYVLVTMGAGAYIMDVPDELHDNDLYRMELFVVLPARWNIQSDEDKDYWPIGTLKAMARYPLEEETWFGHGHTVQFGNDAFPETGFAGYLVSHPCIGGEDAHYCTLQDGSDINFYQLIPLYEDEMDYKIEHGSDALFEKFFETFGTDYDFAIDTRRKNVLYNKQRTDK